MMKCRNCGAIIQGITCPVCGHKQLKNAQCSVCFTNIFPGQNSCPNCGNPTFYKKTENIKPMTPDTIIHSAESHNYHTVSESYDYKKNAYHYNEGRKTPTFQSIFEPIKSNDKNRQSSKTAKKRVVPLFLVVFSVFLVFGLLTTFVVFERFHNTFFFEDQGTVDLDYFTFDNTTQSEYNCYFNRDGLVYVYDDILYLAKYDGIYAYEDGEEGNLIVNGIDCTDLYVDDNGLYFIDDDTLKVYQDDEIIEILNHVDRCYHLGHEIIYQSGDGQLIYYNIDNAITYVIATHIEEYMVDDFHRYILVMYEQGTFSLFDFNGQLLNNHYNPYQYSRDSYFVDGQLCYKDYNAVYLEDVMTKMKQTVMEDVDFYQMAMIYQDDQQFYVKDYDNSLIKVYKDGDDLVYVDIDEDIKDYYIIGEHVIYNKYDDDYYLKYYIANGNGEYTML